MLRQLLTESLIISGIAGGLGIALALALLRASRIDPVTALRRE